VINLQFLYEYFFSLTLKIILCSPLAGLMNYQMNLIRLEDFQDHLMMVILKPRTYMSAIYLLRLLSLLHCSVKLVCIILLASHAMVLGR
jgi:hypothetical protein